jgi:uncharacterized protein (DUF58 family)
MWPFKTRPKPAAAETEAAPRETPAALLRRLNWQTLRPMATLLGGDERSNLRRAGMELHELRPYQPGDDVRHIDWNITARADEPFVREARSERGLDVWLLVDTSPSVDWGTASCLKRDRAELFVAIAAQILGRRGHRVGLITFGQAIYGIERPKAGVAHLVALLTALREKVQHGRGATDLTGALEKAGALIRRPSMLIVISDFIAPDGWTRALGRLTRRHDVIGVHLSDPREKALPDVGLVTFEDPETGGQMLVDTSDKQLRARYAVAAEQDSARIRADFLRAGGDYLALDTEQEPLPALTRMLHARAARTRLRGAQHAQGRPAYATVV